MFHLTQITLAKFFQTWKYSNLDKKCAQSSWTHFRLRLEIGHPHLFVHHGGPFLGGVLGNRGKKGPMKKVWHVSLRRGCKKEAIFYTYICTFWGWVSFVFSLVEKSEQNYTDKLEIGVKKSKDGVWGHCLKSFHEQNMIFQSYKDLVYWRYKVFHR